MERRPNRDNFCIFSLSLAAPDIFFFLWAAAARHSSLAMHSPRRRPCGHSWDPPHVAHTVLVAYYARKPTAFQASGAHHLWWGRFCHMLSLTNWNCTEAVPPAVTYCTAVSQAARRHVALARQRLCHLRLKSCASGSERRWACRVPPSYVRR
eukprot:2585581-Prymnesium_polylepis.1